MKTIVYAASDATFIEIDSAKFWTPPETFFQSGKSYRRLTPEYWAWFHHKYLLMEQALVNGKISEKTFVEILDRIAVLYNQAFAAFGKETLDEAVRTTDVREQDTLIRNKNISEKNTTSPGEIASDKKVRKRSPSIVAERKKNSRG